MRVAHTSISSTSALSSATPSTITNANGGSSSSTQIATRGSRASAFPFTVPAPVVNTRASPSRTNQIRATCGAPLARAPAGLPVRGPWARKAWGSSGLLSLLLAAPTIVAHGNERQKHEDLFRILSGQDAWCQLFSEPGAGSDLASLGTRAVKDGDEWIVNGQKVWTSTAKQCNVGMLIARTDV